MPHIHDISVPWSADAIPWPGDTPFSCTWTARIPEGSSVNLGAFTSSPHVGTHADAPWHVMEAGGRSDIIPLAAFVGRAWLSDVCTLHGELSLADLQLPPEGPIERLLLRSDHTVALGSFPDAWPWLSAPCVEQLIDRGLRLLAVDCPSVDDRHSKTLAVHHAVFGAGAFVLENLDLRQLAPAWYDLVAAPLRIEGMDAAPARAFIILHG